jgi:hypothetical protein
VPQKWHPDAIRVIGRTAGSHAAGSGPKILHHTTEGSSAAGAIAAYRSHGGWPTFTVEWTGARLRIYQHMPLDVAARALAHPSGPETNRANVVQIEHVGFAASSEDWPRARFEAIASLCRWIEAQTGCPAQRGPNTVWGQDHPPRVSGTSFFAGRGHYAHQHAPGNLHWDWGEGNIALVLEGGDHVRRNLTAGDRGADVEAFQRACNRFIARWCQSRDDRRLVVDGVVGDKTLATGAWVAWMLGLYSSQDRALLGEDGRPPKRISGWAQRLVRHPKRRGRRQIAAGAARRRRHCNPRRVTA